MERIDPRAHKALAVLLIAMLALGFAAFIVTQTVAGLTLASADDSNAADAPAEGVGGLEPPGPDVRPEPGATPDTSKSWWYVPYINADEDEPRYDQTIAGILIGPNVGRSGVPCEGEAGWTQFSAADDTPVDISPSYVPVGAVLANEEASACSGTLVVAYRAYEWPADEAAMKDVAAGRKSFFDVPHGGRVEILRFRGDPVVQSPVAAARWFEGTVAGRPAALAGPILDGGLGLSAVVIHESGVVTVIHGHDMTLEELIRVAEGVLS